jgi:hypothetical protein
MEIGNNQASLFRIEVRKRGSDIGFLDGVEGMIVEIFHFDVGAAVEERIVKVLRNQHGMRPSVLGDANGSELCGIPIDTDILGEFARCDRIYGRPPYPFYPL